MATSELRCEHCGTPLQPDDIVCPACGASVNPEPAFPQPEEFVHPSYQNVDPAPPQQSQEAVVIDVEPTPQPFASTPQQSYAYTEPATSSTRNRGCWVACGVLALVIMCCILPTLAVLWYTGDAILNILRSMGF